MTVVVLNNSLLGAQRHAENAKFGETTTGIEFAPVDHAAIASAVGATGITVDHPDAVAPALRKALDSGRVTVLDVVVDPDAYPPVRAFDAFADRLNAPPRRTGARTAT